ncbi:MAG: tRNA (adenosine(37)-N6)-dimethylallyltransferase MiaA [Thermoleophilia bacterium]
MVAVIAVFGPTASGKSAVAEAVADRLQTEVVSCDALQVYRGLPILTNQPTRPTRLVGIREPSEEMSVGAYATLAHDTIDALVAAHGAAVVCGGTGLYLRAALADMAVPPRPASGVRERIQAEVHADPVVAHQRLADVDPRAAAAVHVNDVRRLVRALELTEAGYSLVPDDDRLWASSTRHPTLIVGLDVPAAQLERRIAERTDAMFTAGVVAEVLAARAAGVSHTAAQALGLEEIAMLPPQEARNRIVVRTRRYAAYQRKWMRRVPGLVSVDGMRTPEEIAEEIVGMVASRPL